MGCSPTINRPTNIMIFGSKTTEFKLSRMHFNYKLFLKTFWMSFFKSDGTPGRITPKRFFVLMFIFLAYPLWHFSFRLAYGLDQLFYPDLIHQAVEQPIFIVGNFRSGTTLLHRLLAKDERFTGMKSWEIYVSSVHRATKTPALGDADQPQVWQPNPKID